MGILSKLISNIRYAISKVPLSEYGNLAADRIKTRTRLGYGIQGGERGASKYPLKSINRTPAYEKFRKKTSILNKTATSARRHNLTLTGQLLNSMKGASKNKQIIVRLNDKRADGGSNLTIMEAQAKLGRHFFELTDKELKGLRNQIKKDLISLYKKTKKRK